MKPMISAAVVALAISCTTEVDTEKIRITEYKDGKACAVSLTFDDGMKEHYTIVAPELEKRGWRGTFWLCGAWIHDDPETDPTHITWDEAVRMHEKGHEMSNHSWSHPNLTELSPEALAAEITMNDDAIFNHIGTRPVTFCFPYNAYNDDLINTVMIGRIGARLKEFWLGGQHCPEGYLENQIETAIADSTWITGMTHGITYGYDCYENPDDFTGFLDYLKSKEEQIWIGTFREVAAYTEVYNNTLLEIEQKGKHLTVTPKTDLDAKLYATMLTLEIPSYEGEIKATQDDTMLQTLYRNGNIYISFNPFGGEINIRL